LSQPNYSSTLFPYTTLFRSGLAQETTVDFHLIGHGAIQTAGLDVQVHLVLRLVGHHVHACGLELAQGVLLLRAALEHAELLALRSEEHTSELQSRENLLCRL